MGRQRKARADDANLPGLEPVKNDKVHKAAEWYVKQRDARMALTKVEKEAKDTLLGEMTSQGITDYEYKGLVVHVDIKRDVKATINGKPAEEAEEAE